jgi:hypothetical protein
MKATYRKNIFRVRRWHCIVIGLIIIFVLIGCSSESTTPQKKQDSPLSIEESHPETEKDSEGESPDARQIIEDCLSEYDDPDEFLSFQTPAGLWGARAADFNDDNWPDVMLWRGQFQTGDSFEIDFLLNDGIGKLRLGTTEILTGPISSVVEGREVLIEDFNGDGRPDLFFADQGMDSEPWPGSQNILVLSAHDGKMKDATSNLPQQSDQTHSVAAADIENDGDIDLFIGNLGGGGVSPQMLINDGSGKFNIDNDVLPREHVDLMRNWYTSSLFADINNDGYADLILGQAETNKESHVLINDGTGNFLNAKASLPQSFFAPNQTVLDIQAEDINGDDFVDLILSETRSSYVGRYIQVLINNGDETFTDETQIRLPQSDNKKPWIIWINLVDLNLDNYIDIIASPMGDKEPLFFLNNGDGNFQPQENVFNIEVDNLFTYLDVDQDGLMDFFWSYPSCDDGSCPETHFIVKAIGCK